MRTKQTHSLPHFPVFNRLKRNAKRKVKVFHFDCRTAVSLLAPFPLAQFDIRASW